MKKYNLTFICITIFSLLAFVLTANAATQDNSTFFLNPDNSSTNASSGLWNGGGTWAGGEDSSAADAGISAQTNTNQGLSTAAKTAIAVGAIAAIAGGTALILSHHHNKDKNNHHGGNNTNITLLNALVTVHVEGFNSNQTSVTDTPNVTITFEDQHHKYTGKYTEGQKKPTIVEVPPGTYKISGSSWNGYTVNPQYKSIQHSETITLVYSKKTDNFIHGNATWLYDATYPDGPTGKPGDVPGLWVDQLQQYNENALAAHQISIIFSYGGDAEMYCRGSGPDHSNDVCNASNVYVYYSDDSKKSTTKYQGVTGVKHIMPIVDGRLDGEYLKTFNKNPDHVGKLVADKIAAEYCKDPNVDGVQVDLEPFDISQPGQQELYSQLGADFAKAPCVDQDHPNGRFFSVFAFPKNITDEQWHTIATDFGNNGFFVVSGYDLGDEAGKAISPIYSLKEHKGYDVDLEKELTIMKAKAQQYRIHYMVGIPAAASTTEFEKTENYQTKVQTPSGYTQLDYVNAALRVITDLGLKNDPKFLGTSIWGWSVYMAYPPHSIHLFLPSTPSEAILDYLKNNL